MISVLHLLGDQPDFETRQTLARIRASLGDNFSQQQFTIGPGQHWRHVPAAIFGLKKLSFDVVHAWGVSALWAAIFAGARRIIFSSTFPLDGASPRSLRILGWVRSAMACRNVQMVCPTYTQHRLALRLGINPARCQVIRPGVSMAGLRRGRDPALRSRLGFADDDYVLMAGGETTRAASHERAVWACGILHVLDPHYKLLTWGQGALASSAQRLGAKLHQPDLVTSAASISGATIEPQDLAGAADAVLITANAAVSTLPVVMAMAAGLPMIATVTSTISELLEDRHTALMVAGQSPREIARRVLDLRADSRLQWAICDMARTEAYEFFSVSSMLEQYRSLYQSRAQSVL